jgi:hypothetical protein
VGDADDLDARETVARELAQQVVFAVRVLVRQLLERVVRAVVLDEAHDVTADPRSTIARPLDVPLLERVVPRQVEEVRLAGRGTSWKRIGRHVSETV